MKNPVISRTTFFAKLICFFLLSSGMLLPASAQTPGGRQQSSRPAAGIYPATDADDNTGFVSIFDGTLKGWDGDPTFWRAENGTIIGETTPEKVVKVNNFLIWRENKVKDFELKLDFRINSTNSGIQFRSTEMPEIGKWILKGYQADIEFANGYTGNIHEERGRKGHVVLSRRGEVTRAVDGPGFKTVATIGDPTLLKGVVNIGGWNRYHIIARGPVIMQIINGQLISVLLDEDSKNFIPEGVIGFQMHTGPSFKVEYRNIFYKKL